MGPLPRQKRNKNNLYPRAARSINNGECCIRLCFCCQLVVGVIKVSLTCQRVAKVRPVFAVGGWLFGGGVGCGRLFAKRACNWIQMFANDHQLCVRGCAYANVAFLLILIRREIKPLTIKRFLLTNSLKQEISLYKLSSISYLKFLS